MNKVWAFRRTPYSLDECCIPPYRTKNEQSFYFLTRSSHTWQTCHSSQIKLQLECDMGWYRYTSHSENHHTECDIDWYRHTSHSENHCTECDMGWDWYTSHSENHHTECDMGWYWYTSHSENHHTECDMDWYRYTSHIVKTTTKSVIWTDTDIRLIGKTTAQSVRSESKASKTRIKICVKKSICEDWYYIANLLEE